MDFQRLRGRVPLVAFILLAAICLLLIGFTCACLSEQPAKAVDRAVSVGAEIAGVIEMWSHAALATLLGGLLLTLLATGVRANGRASPAELQRFLI